MQTLALQNNEVSNELQNAECSVLPLWEKRAIEFICDSLNGKMPSLIPFAAKSKSVVRLASYLLKYTTGSKYTLYQYIFGIHRFCVWIGRMPDDLVKDGVANKKAVDETVLKLDEFIGDLRAEKLAHGTVNNHVKGVKALFRASGISLTLPFRVPKTVQYPDRSPTPEELAQMMDVADLRDKVIVSLLALSGVRIGTLVKLQYRHVKRDLESGVVPVHMHIEAEITKGKYHDYDTFIDALAFDQDSLRFQDFSCPHVDQSSCLDENNSRGVRFVLSICISERENE